MKTKLQILITTLGLLIIASSGMADPSVVYVDDGYTAATPGWGVDHFAAIQDGIDAVAISGTVNVADGSYGADAVSGKAAYINKSLTLLGESRDGTIIDGTIGGVGSSGSYWPVGIHVGAASNVTVKNFTVTGFTGDLSSTGGYGVLFRDYAHDTPAEGRISYSSNTAENVKVTASYSSRGVST